MAPTYTTLRTHIQRVTLHTPVLPSPCTQVLVSTHHTIPHPSYTFLPYTNSTCIPTHDIQRTSMASAAARAEHRPQRAWSATMSSWMDARLYGRLSNPGIGSRVRSLPFFCSSARLSCCRSMRAAASVGDTWASRRCRLLNRGPPGKKTRCTKCFNYWYQRW